LVGSILDNGLISAAAATLTGPAITIGGTLAVTNTASLVAAGGTISDTGLITADTAVLSAASISIGGALNATTTAALTATGAISETGVLNAGTLTGSSGTTASFTGTNSIATLGDFRRHWRADAERRPQPVHRRRGHQQRRGERQ